MRTPGARRAAAATGGTSEPVVRRAGRTRAADGGSGPAAGIGTDAPAASGPLPVVPLRRDELPVDAADLARFMIGKYLVHDLAPVRVAGRIVETEAYPVGDSTSHAYAGRRPYNGSMFLARGHAYVRLTYGSSFMLNMSAEEADVGAGVLIRAVEPLEGLDAMSARRPGVPLRDLARGPGRLTMAFGIGAAFDGVDLCAGRGLWIGRLDEPARPVGVTTRIGLSREMHRPLRFYELGSPFVSGPRRLLATALDPSPRAKRGN